MKYFGTLGEVKDTMVERIKRSANCIFSRKRRVVIEPQFGRFAWIGRAWFVQ